MVSSHDNHPSTAIAEADRLAQQQPTNPGVSSDRESPAWPTNEVNEADLLEQARTVFTDPDEEYMPDTG